MRNGHKEVSGDSDETQRSEALTKSDIERMNLAEVDEYSELSFSGGDIHLLVDDLMTDSIDLNNKKKGKFLQRFESIFKKIR